MTHYGLLIDNEYCTGCHSCEVACKNEHDLPLGQWGIKVLELGPWKLMDGKHWEYRYVPVPTSYCDLCADRVEAGERQLRAPLPGERHGVRHAGGACREAGGQGQDGLHLRSLIAS